MLSSLYHTLTGRNVGFSAIMVAVAGLLACLIAALFKPSRILVGGIVASVLTGTVGFMSISVPRRFHDTSQLGGRVMTPQPNVLQLVVATVIIVLLIGLLVVALWPRDDGKKYEFTVSLPQRGIVLTLVVAAIVSSITMVPVTLAVNQWNLLSFVCEVMVVILIGFILTTTVVLAVSRKKRVQTNGSLASLSAPRPSVGPL
jgi:hypothetical protein